MAVKTNAMRLLEQAGVAFTPHEYPVDDGALDAVSVARKLSVPPEQVFKTLLVEAPGPEFLVLIVPGDRELDLRLAARACGRKNLALAPRKQLPTLTGYQHGGCSPVGMKKPFPAWLDETAQLYDRIWVSGGRIGLNLELSPTALAALLKAPFVELT